MPRGDRPHGARARTHHDRLGLDRRLADAHAPQERAAGDAGRGDEDVVAPHEVVVRKYLVDLEARLDERRPLAVVAGPEAALERAAEALDRRGRDDAFGRPA